MREWLKQFKEFIGMKDSVIKVANKSSTSGVDVHQVSLKFLLAWTSMLSSQESALNP